MAGGCVNCAAPAGERHALRFSDGSVVSDMPLCEACSGAFREADWIRVVDDAEGARRGAAGRV